MQLDKIDYSFCPNHRETMMALARVNLGSQEWRVITALLLQTDGYVREEDEISNSFWQTITLISRQNISPVLTRLIEQGMVNQEVREGKAYYRLKHPNDWPLEVFGPQQISKRALAQARAFLTKTKARDRPQFVWLRRLLDTYGNEKRLQPQTVSRPKASSTTDGFSEQKRLQPETDRLQSQTVPSSTTDVLNAPKDNTKENSKESIVVVVKLTQFGISEMTAERIAKDYDLDYIAEKIELVQWFLDKEDSIVENPGGFLRRAIEENYRSPRSYKSKAQRDAEAERIRELEEKARAEMRALIERGREEHPPMAINDKLDTAAAWEQVLHILQGETNRANFDTWLRDTLLLEVREGTAVVGVPTMSARDWLDRRLKSRVVKALMTVVGARLEVEFRKLESADEVTNGSKPVLNGD